MTKARSRRGRPSLASSNPDEFFIRQLNDHRKAVGRPKGFRIPGCKGATGQQVVIPYWRICIEVDVRIAEAADQGLRLSERRAVIAALESASTRFDCVLRLLPNDPMVETALRKIRAYRRAHRHEYQDRFIQ